MSALLTDLYQLAMLSAYVREGMHSPAVFELYVRRLPRTRNFLVAAGLAQAVEYLETLRFEPDELAWLADSGRFSPDVVAYLARLRFTGDVDAMPEGTVFFADEPILRVTAPLPEAQLVESRLLNLMHVQTLIASKAVRAVLVAPGKQLVDFGLRRAHGAEAALLAARVTHLAGFAGSSNVLAGQRFGIPVFGTMAHSFVQAHDVEADAFAAFARDQPAHVVLLLDTYDIEAAARVVVEIAPRLAAQGITVRGVRIDSGDLGAEARRVRRSLDAGGLEAVTIFASGDLDEYRVRDLIAADAPIDGFGLGTRITTSADAPWLDCVYKLQEYAGRPRRKRSPGKATWPGGKQVYRTCAGGRMVKDVVTLESDRQDGDALLRPVMRSGKRCEPLPTLTESRLRLATQLASLPETLRGLEEAPAYPVEVAPAVRALVD
jgi:nicotinate phosphoribosyltransferase